MTTKPSTARSESDLKPAGWELWRGLLEASFRVERERMLLHRLHYQAAASDAASARPVLEFSKLLLDYVVKMLRDAANETTAPAADPPGSATPHPGGDTR